VNNEQGRTAAGMVCRSIISQLHPVPPPTNEGSLLILLSLTNIEMSVEGSCPEARQENNPSLYTLSRSQYYLQ
jgi:hypothetical protein